MPDALTFMMGNHPAPLPGELRYCKNHMWCRPGADGVHTFGFTAYAVRLMQDVYFLEWSIDAGDAIRRLQEIGHIETSKAESDLFAPLKGTLSAFNEALLADPSGINVDNYGAGWLYEIAGDDVSVLMDVTGYHKFLADGWEKTQQMIKGKINTEED
jgi:glycine cleavage system H protein